SIDGERCEGPRFTFTVVPKALRVLTGPDYHPVPLPVAAIEDEAAGDAPAPGPTLPVAPQGLGPRAFGMVAGVLLLAKRTPAAYAVGLGLIAVAVLVFAWVANGAVGGRWEAWN